MDLKERCATADKDYSIREKTRRDELSAISDAIQLLSEDEARDLFSKTLSLLQTTQRRSLRVASTNEGSVASSSRAEVIRFRRQKASATLLAATRHGQGASAIAGNLHLAKLAVAAQLDDFSKVKEIMDKMVVELKKQQSEEYEKHETCKKDVASNERQTREK